MTRKQRDMKARSFRLLAGRIYVNMYNLKLSAEVRAELHVAHDAMCRAFNKLEDGE